MTQNGTAPLESLYRAWMTEIHGNPAITLDEIRDMFEHCGDVTREPGQVDYRVGEAAGVPVLWVEPKGCRRDKVLLCAHGGGYVLGSVYSHRKLFAHFASRMNCRALLVDYRRAPEHPHPAPVDDMVSVYRWLLGSGEITGPKDALFLGDSAGGALAITGMLGARDQGLPLPAGAVALSPYLDTEATGASYDRNVEADAMGSREATLQFMALFLGEGGNPRDPLANPLHAELGGLPSIFLQVGTHDVLEDDSVRFAERARQAGIDVSLNVVSGMPHVFHFLAGNLAEADEAIDRAVAWARPHLGLV